MRGLRRWDVLALLAVLLLAAALRLGEPGVLEFLHDEAMLSLMAQDMAAGGSIPLTGIPSSVGIPNPPTSVYVMALPYALSHSPQFATLFVAALNVIGVGLLWGIARRWFGAGVALAAGLIYAVNPWALLYSRKIWAQDFQTPFILLALLLALYGFREGRRWAQVLCLPVLFFGLQIHFAAWALLPLFIVLIVRGLRRRDGIVAAAIIGILLALLTLLPFALGLADTLAREPYRLENLLNRGGGGLSLSADALRYSLNLASGLGLETWVAPQQQVDLLAQIAAPSALLVVALALLVIGTWAVLRRPLGWLLIAWALLPLLVFTPTWTPVYPHYFITALPAYALLMGVGAVYVFTVLRSVRMGCIPSLRPILRPALMTVGAALLITQVLYWRGVLRYVETTATPYGFGTPMSGLLAVRDALADEDDVLV
ncbi:MAG: glycosyltransferase family 39 protein, partial [Anaerolineae bacterium]|nr:glycosyltransferase family 39 protein [Anaerolineae bacterium]